MCGSRAVLGRGDLSHASHADAVRQRVATFWQHFSKNKVITVINVIMVNGRKPLGIQEEPRFLAALNLWS